MSVYILTAPLLYLPPFVLYGLCRKATNSFKIAVVKKNIVNMVNSYKY